MLRDCGISRISSIIFSVGGGGIRGFVRVCVLACVLFLLYVSVTYTNIY